MDLNSRNGGVWKTEVIIFWNHFSMFFKYGVKNDLKNISSKTYKHTPLEKRSHGNFDYISDEKTKTKR